MSSHSLYNNIKRLAAARHTMKYSIKPAAAQQASLSFVNDKIFKSFYNKNRLPGKWT